MKEGDKMGKPEKSTEELLQLMHENNQKMNLYKLESDENGNYLLDPSNPHHREWMENDDEYEVISEEKKPSK